MILNSLDDFIKAMPTAVTLDNWADIETYVDSAEMWIQNEILGKALYESINADASPEAVLVKLCHNVIANHAFHLAIPFLDLTLNNNGFAVVRTDNLAPASPERVERLMKQCLYRRDTEVDNLIGFLEANSDYHDDWKSSPVYSILSECLICTANELKRFANWDGNRKDFLMLKPKMVALTRQVIEPKLSKDYVQELIENQRDNELGSADLEVLLYAKSALGLLISDNQLLAGHTIGDALRAMDAAPDSYATYFASSEYSARTATGYENSEDSPIFSSLR